MACIVEGCCFCVNLRTGSLIVGYLNLVAFSMAFFSSVYSFVLIVENILGVFAPAASAIVPACMGAMKLLIALLKVMLTVALVYGVHMRESRYMRPYVINIAIILIFRAVSFIVSFQYISPRAEDIVIDLLTMILIGYSLLVTRSYYLQLGTTRPPDTNQNMPPVTISDTAVVYIEPPTKTLSENA